VLPYYRERIREIAIRGEERRQGLDTLFWIFISAPLPRRREAMAV
jgi:hypothetical protein